jgi:4'-phosphopantetheinyl transferase EntD
MAGDALQHREFVHLHFAIKEAVYKAIDPLVRRYVGFREVEVLSFTGGAAEVRLHLPELQDAPLRIETQWTIEQEWIRTTAVSRSIDQSFAWQTTT